MIQQQLRDWECLIGAKGQRRMADWFEMAESQQQLKKN